MNESVNPSTVELWLRALLGLAEDQSPFAWQLEMFRCLRQGKVARSLDIPTGLGKTSVIALWLAARACGAALPRRLVYVVDRRAVVDQATEVAVNLRRCVDGETPELVKLKASLGIPQKKHLPISTLRGQFVDNREWLVDPVAPAIIVGTVDMVGSRLLFEGYGVSRKMRPYHAGFLGADTLVVLDEAHLVPPFEKLIEAIANGVEAFGPTDKSHRTLVPPLQLMSLSATGRVGDSATFRLTEDDRKPGTVTRKRLDAPKSLTIEPTAADENLAARLAKEVWALAKGGSIPIRCIVFANERREAESARSELEKLVGADRKTGDKSQGSVDIELFVGGRRVFEREAAAVRLKELGFIAGSEVKRTSPAFLFATSAAEVGVDLDADHLVCDLVEWERMVQRLGRVNRRGNGIAKVKVIRPPANPKKENDALRAERLDAVSLLLGKIPTNASGGVNASPGALADLRAQAEIDPAIQALVHRASTPSPLHPALTRQVVESWSMTSLEQHTGRPEVDPWLRGWIEEEAPMTTIIWREILPITSAGDLLSPEECEAFLEAAGPHVAEKLEIEAWHAAAWVSARLAKLKASESGGTQPSAETEVSTGSASTAGLAHGTPQQVSTPLTRRDVAAIVVGKDDNLFPIRGDFEDDDKRHSLETRLSGATLIVDTRLGGLGVASTASQDEVRTTGLLDINSDLATDISRSALTQFPFQVRLTTSDGASDRSDSLDDWREEARIATKRTDLGDEIEWIVIESRSNGPAETEEGRAVSSGKAQLIEEHQSWAERAAQNIADRLGFEQEYSNVLTTAARLHDEGKRSKRWQRAFHAPSDGLYAKTKSRPSIQLLAGYRHELGSIPYAEADTSVAGMSAELRDLCLHLIASHHGRARPLIPVSGADDPPTRLEERARQVAGRFARLERQWGPWGLAWWESLLRSADQQASRENDEQGATGG